LRSIAIAGRTITFQHADGGHAGTRPVGSSRWNFFSADRDNPRAARVDPRRLPEPTRVNTTIRFEKRTIADVVKAVD
jgi:hypothetical protein